MGTQGSITVYDEDGKDIANIVTQYDGYDLYEWVERFVSGKQLTNGISNDYDFNGMGDLAARLIAALKNQRYKGDIGQSVKPGNVYLYDTPYKTDYHITLVYQGEGKKPKMTVSTPEWTDNYYDNTMLPPLGEANVRMQGAETFNADSTPRFIPVEVIKYDAWWTRRYGREYNPTLFGNDYDDSYAVCVRDIPIAHFDTKEKAENHANTVSTAISVLGGVTPSTIDHPLALREMDGYADKNIRGGMNMAETFNAENKTMVHQIIAPYEPGGYATTYIYRDEKDVKNALWDMASSRMFEYEEEFPEYDWEGSLDSAENQAIWDKKTKNMSINKIMEYAMLDDDNQYSKISLNLDGFRIDGEYGGVENMARKEGILRAETFNAYKVAPALSSYSKDELISSKAGPQGSASYDEMVYDPIAQDRLSAEAFASDEEKRLKAFAKKIENEKKKLVKKAKRSGLYENFGQKEVRKLEDSISDLDYYEQQKYQEMIRDFDNWADSIDLRGLERYAESFASETSSTLKSMGYVAGTIGVGYLIFQRFVKDRLDETMNQ